MKSTRDYLLQYLELGFHPIPLIGKVPCCKWKDFTLTKGNMSAFKKKNWGLRTDQIGDHLFFYAVDLDSKELLSDFWGENTLPAHPLIVSTGRGFHIYFTWTEPVKTMHFLVKDNKKIDIIGNGAYVVAPPSRHPNGRYYQFITPLESVPPLMDPGKLILPPQIILNNPVHLAQNSSSGSLNSGSLRQYIENGAPDGMRHTTLIGYIGALIKSCFTEEEALVKILAWNKLNRPPLPEDEVIKTVHDCYEKWG
jgi:hypothetical protein